MPHGKQYLGLRSRDLGGHYLYHHNPAIDQEGDVRDSISLQDENGVALCTVTTTKQSYFLQALPRLPFSETVDVTCK